jgi:tetratricopeptide (TPR) repeat protein
LQVYEPAGWAEEILEAATAAGLAQLPRLYAAASLCAFTGRAEAGVAFAQAAEALQADPRFDPFDPGWSRYLEGLVHLLAGRLDRCVEICAGLAGQSGLAQVLGRCGLLYALQAAGRTEEARAMAETTLATARNHDNPYFIAMAMFGSGRAFAQADPAQALRVLREGIVYARQHRLPLLEAGIAPHAAALEAAHGNLWQALALSETAIDMSHGAGNVVIVATTFANLAVCFDRLDRPDVAATLYGASNPALNQYVADLPAVANHLRAVLGDGEFDQCVATGAAMDLANAVGYARQHIQLARRQTANPGPGRT